MTRTPAGAWGRAVSRTVASCAALNGAGGGEGGDDGGGGDGGGGTHHHTRGGGDGDVEGGVDGGLEGEGGGERGGGKGGVGERGGIGLSAFAIAAIVTNTATVNLSMPTLRFMVYTEPADFNKRREGGGAN